MEYGFMHLRMSKWATETTLLVLVVATLAGCQGGRFQGIFSGEAEGTVTPEGAQALLERWSPEGTVTPEGAQALLERYAPGGYAGALDLQSYGTGTVTPEGAQALLERYAPGGYSLATVAPEAYGTGTVTPEGAQALLERWGPATATQWSNLVGPTLQAASGAYGLATGEPGSPRPAAPH
jgi:hypothetical protein